MYAEYWKIRESPFRSGSDPGYFFRSATHQAALLKLRYLVESRQGAGLLAGESGAGKSLLTGMLEDELGEGAGPVVRLFYPQMSSLEFLSWLAIELGASESDLHLPGQRVDLVVRAVEGRLIELGRQERHPVIVVDDAHVIEDMKVYQSMRLLLNLLDRADVDFSLTLVGEPPLLARMPRIGALNDRLGVRALIRAFSPEETAQYVAHRLTFAGCERALFDGCALEAVFERSGGIPRRINQLCDMALLVGYADRLSVISAREVEGVAEELGTALAE